MKLELNTNGAWRTVLSGLGRQDKDAEDRYLDARTAADMLARISAAAERKPIAWRLTSEADGRVIERCEGTGGWMNVAYDPERAAWPLSPAASAPLPTSASPAPGRSSVSLPTG